MKFILGGQPLLAVFLLVSPLNNTDFTALPPKNPFLQFYVNMELYSIFAYFCKNGIV